MWLGSDLIGVVLPSETPSYKPDKWYQSRWLIPAQTSSEPMVNTDSDEFRADG